MLTPEPARGRARILTLSLGALGIVYGDIGTSPLYALRECFTGADAPDINLQNVLGILSLIFWSLIVVVSIEYVGFILNADNRGEGGVLSLLALVSKRAGLKAKKGLALIILLGVLGSALIFGDGVITPAITVLGAVEGLKVIAPVLGTYIVTCTLIILAILFFVQRLGSGRIGVIFGPIMLVWFSAIGLLGLKEILEYPFILSALNPTHAVRFFINNGWRGFFYIRRCLFGYDRS